MKVYSVRTIDTEYAREFRIVMYNISLTKNAADP